MEKHKTTQNGKEIRTFVDMKTRQNFSRESQAYQINFFFISLLHIKVRFNHNVIIFNSSNKNTKASNQYSTYINYQAALS